MIRTLQLRHPFLYTLAVVATGLGLMIWIWLRAASISTDGAHYMELAERAWRLGPQAGMDWYSGPAYPVAAGWVYGLAGDLEFAGRLTSFLFGLATLVGVGRLAGRLFGSTVAVLAVGLLAVHITFARHAVMAETDTAYGCWLVWGVLCSWELKHAAGMRRQLSWALLAGLCLGLGYLTRPEAMPLCILLVVWYLAPATGSTSSAAQLGRGRRALWAIVVVTVCLAIALPYLLELRAELGHWGLSGKERSIVLKFVPDKRNYQEVLELGISGALLHKPSNILHWLPYHLHWGLPQLVKALHPVVLVLGAIGMICHRYVKRAPGATGLLLWVSLPFLIFFFLIFPGRRYFMQAIAPWTILAAVGTVELAGMIGHWRKRSVLQLLPGDSRRAAQRACTITLLTPTVLMVALSLVGNREPLDRSRLRERVIGERILETAGPGRRVLTFTVAAFYARAQRVPLWGPMEGIVRCHGYGKPLSYEELLGYVKSHQVEYVVVDHDIRKDCPEFLGRAREDFELVINDIHDGHGPCLVYRYAGRHAQRLGAN